MNTQQQGRKAASILLLLLCCALIFTVSSYASPSGATITNNATVTSPAQAPGSRSDARGTITTMVLNSIQQDTHWKAYVGNVSGYLSLQNPNNYTIYAWDMTNITGQVYASRFNNITWPGVTCASNAVIVAENTYVNHSTSIDNITKTFNSTTHKAFTVSNDVLAQNTCPSMATFVNNTRQALGANTPYQEILIDDVNSQLIYLADISDNANGYDNQPYDFQMIVADNHIGTPTPYYFYVELRG